MRQLVHQELTHEVIGSFFSVYSTFGYGFVETPYVNALALELHARGLQGRREAPIELFYKGRKVGFYRADLIVEDKVLVETKASAALGEADNRQVFNYLRASKLTVGLLLHFGPTPNHKRFVWTGKHFDIEIDPAVT
jgi:GxxExxY protein